MAETPPGGPAGPMRVGEWVRGGPTLQSVCVERDPSFLSQWGGSPGAERAGRGWSFVQESLPTGFCLRPGVGQVTLQRGLFSLQKPQQGPMKGHSSAQGLSVGPLHSFAALGRHLVCA